MFYKHNLSKNATNKHLIDRMDGKIPPSGGYLPMRSVVIYLLYPSMQRSR